MSVVPIVMDGVLRADGTLQFDAPPSLPPGRVRVTLQPLEDSNSKIDRLPDPPWPDDSISAPFDLPRPDSTERTWPRTVTERLPELLAEAP